jgi:PAS domain S-box-containing protein
MRNEFSIRRRFSGVRSVQTLRERISELEEQVRNLRQIEATLHRNTALFEALIAASHDGIALTRADGTIIRVIHSILGYPGTTLAGVPVSEVVHPDDRLLMAEALRRLREDGVRYIEHELRMLKPDGSAIWVHGSMTDMIDHPAVQAVVHNYRAVTARGASVNGPAQSTVATLQLRITSC